MSTSQAIIFSIEVDSITVTISYDACDLKKATNEGLVMMLEMLVAQEMYERAAKVLNEINFRKNPVS